MLRDHQIGNLYQSEGIVLALPTLDTDEMQAYVNAGAGSEDDFLSEAFSLVEDALRGSGIMNDSIEQAENTEI